MYCPLESYCACQTNLSSVEHCIAYILVYPHLTRIHCLSGSARSTFHNTTSRASYRRWIEQSTQIAPGPFAHEIREISRGTNADSFSCPSKEVAQIICQVLKDIPGREGASFGSGISRQKQFSNAPDVRSLELPCGLVGRNLNCELR